MVRLVHILATEKPAAQPRPPLSLAGLALWKLCRRCPVREQVGACAGCLGCGLKANDRDSCKGEGDDLECEQARCLYGGTGLGVEDRCDGGQLIGAGGRPVGPRHRWLAGLLPAERRPRHGRSRYRSVHASLPLPALHQHQARYRQPGPPVLRPAVQSSRAQEPEARY